MRRTVWAIGTTALLLAVPALTRCLKDPVAGVRTAAAVALAALDDNRREGAFRALDQARAQMEELYQASQARLAPWEAAGRLASRQQQVVARRRWQSWSRPSSPARHVCGTGSRTGPARRHAAPPSRRWQPPLERRGWGPSRCFRSWRCPRCWPRCRPPPPAPGSRERMLGHSPSRQAGCRRPRSATTGSSLRRRFRLRPCLRPGSGLPALAMSGR